ncbi:cation transporter [Candidatus Woesebacteria bacterium]|nr:cation transporter [Candidatus Woesebacteria bacterium]
MHSHDHGKTNNLSWAIVINITFTLIEIAGGLFTNSLTILSDALHDFGDSLVLILAWIAEKKSQQGPDQKRTFGYKRLSLGAAVFTSVVLMSGSLFILSKAIPRLLNPEPVHVQGMIFLAIIGVIFNGFGFLKLRSGQSMNEKALTWHLLEDVLGWVMVLIGSVVMYFWNNPIIDPIMTIGYTVFILWGVSKNLKESLNILMQGVPSHINIDHIKKGLLKVKEVVGVHDIHVWSLDGETDVFTGHVVIKDQVTSKAEEMKSLIKTELEKHHIEHSTIEIENESSCSGVDCVTDKHSENQHHLNVK